VARAQIGPDKRGKTGHWLDSYVAYAEISEQTEWPVFSRYPAKQAVTIFTVHDYNLLRNFIPDPLDSGPYAGRLFFNWHQFVAALLGLTLQFGLECFSRVGVPL
jgi:hypothetical protein